MSDTYKLTFGLPDPIVIDNLPLSIWTIVNTDTLSINGDTITQLGIGGWYESMFVSFTVPETGSYKISYDYNITNAKVGNHGTYGFGLWLTTNNPNVSGDAQSSFYTNASNRTGSIIGTQNENISGKHGTASFNANLIAGTTYYLWYPGAALDDGTTYTLSFTNIRIYNNPIQYTYNNILTYPGWGGYVCYEKLEPPILLTPMTTFTWPSMSNRCFTINGNIVTCRGISGFKELLYKTFTVEESGNYTLELDWTSPTGLTLAAPNDDYWNRFGLYIDTSLNINYDGGYQGAMSQGIIMQRSNDTSVITKSQSTTVSLTAGTTYYVWLSYSILADNRNQTIEFTKLQLVKQF